MLDDWTQGEAPPAPEAAPRESGHPPGASTVGEIRAFLSYSRQNLVEADQLASVLRKGGIQVCMDRLNIEPGDDWQERISGLILGCEVFVFGIGPASAMSPICDWEINEAERLSKRIFPVRLLNTLDSEIPRRLLRLQIVEMHVPGERIANAAKLLDSIRVDARWTREHTRLLERAESWKRSGRKSGWLGCQSASNRDPGSASKKDPPAGRPRGHRRRDRRRGAGQGERSGVDLVSSLPPVRSRPAPAGFVRCASSAASWRCRSPGYRSGASAGRAAPWSSLRRRTRSAIRQMAGLSSRSLRCVRRAG
ncbi:hypothetical protein MPEAHAMD_6915 [Methylobacterium frigidaeris]|uniref:TIR domain-containing protein n=1 Tax=Methylobacterium frigidaeris TaxID=2038277 RepID=A0AA37HIF6_9HYPH|nr:hypothetical protein MPEAHAMD_6915 [Methylobacterium frigidaeris]